MYVFRSSQAFCLVAVSFDFDDTALILSKRSVILFNMKMNSPEKVF